jgi:hypothetical protein
MVIFHSYVKLPEGNREVLNTAHLGVQHYDNSMAPISAKEPSPPSMTCHCDVPSLRQPWHRVQMLCPLEAMVTRKVGQVGSANLTQIFCYQWL